jgi:4-amino-4-deoxy-L-arabinose transferase-like glycosyltransferase
MISDRGARRELLAVRPAHRRWAGVPLLALGASAVFAGILVAPAPRSSGEFAACLAVIAGVVVCSVAILLLLGTFAPSASDRIAGRIDAAALVPDGLQVLTALIVATLALRASAVGRIPGQPVVLAIVLPLAFLVGVHGAGHALARLGVFGERLAAAPGAILRAPGLWLIAVTTLLYLPTLGNFTLIDPWETQYAEVAREMLSRRDWLSLWWGDQGWFMSKPILNFWLIAASFVYCGIDYRPERMLEGVAEGRLPQPEWAARFPIFLISVCAVYVLYRGSARAFGWKAALLGGLILVTTPYWFFLSRQSMTDMSCLAPLAAALGFLLTALHAEPEARVKSYEISLWGRVVSLSAFHLFAFVLLALGLAQIFYLLTRHIGFDLSRHPALWLHRDQVFEGSPGNCLLPGNAPCRPSAQASEAFLQPFVTALCSCALLAVLLWRIRRERQVKALGYLAAWLCVSLAFLGKAAPGLVLPVFTLLGTIVALGRFRELAKCQWLGLVLLLATLALPWYVQEAARHGALFFDELFMHDMYERAFAHVHDTNVGDDTSFRYYVWQLGYGLFPWTGAVAAGVLWCLGSTPRLPASPADSARTLAVSLFSVWMLANFGMFCIAGTKFHHYIAPLVPGAALLGGAGLEEWWRQRKDPRAGALGLGAGVMVALVARDLASSAHATAPGPVRLLQLFTYLYSRPWPPGLHFEHELAAFGALAALACGALLVPTWRRGALLGLATTVVAFSLWCINAYLPQVAPHWGQRELISEYYRKRQSPDEPLAAYAQNWMGENFYTGNHVATFKQPGDNFKRWVGELRAKGTSVFFVTTEHSTLSRVRNELGSVQAFDLLTTPEMNNKFVLARITL